MSDRYPHRVWILIPAADRDRANAYAAQMDADDGGDRTFTVGVSPDGTEPPTHYWCATQMRDEPYRQLLTDVLPQFPGAICEDYDLDQEPDYPQRRLAELGLLTVEVDDAV